MGFFYYSLMRFSLSWLLVNRKSLRKQCQPVLLHGSKAPLLLCLQQPGWFFMAGRSSLSLCSSCQNTDCCPCAAREIASASKGREPEGLVSHSWGHSTHCKELCSGSNLGLGYRCP